MVFLTGPAAGISLFWAIVEFNPTSKVEENAKQIATRLNTWLDVIDSAFRLKSFGEVDRVNN